MKTIQISDETWAALQQQAIPLVDDADSLIRRLLNMREDSSVDTTPDKTGTISIVSDVRKNRERGKVGFNRINEVLFRTDCANRSADELSISRLDRLKRTYYVDSDRQTGIVCLVSREYDMTSEPQYWFGFQKRHLDEIKKYRHAYVALGCGTPETTLLIPIEKFELWLSEMNITSKGDSFYWHVHIFEVNGRLEIRRREGSEKVDVSPFKL